MSRAFSRAAAKPRQRCPSTVPVPAAAACCSAGAASPAAGAPPGLDLSSAPTAAKGEARAGGSACPAGGAPGLMRLSPPFFTASFFRQGASALKNASFHCFCVQESRSQRAAVAAA